MPYVKQSAIQGAFDSYEIVGFTCDMDQKSISVSMRKTTIDSVTGIPRILQIICDVKDMNAKILDPNWNAQSTPAKPTGFDINDATTWGGLTYSQFPFVTDPAKQFFSSLAVTDPVGTSIFGRIKKALYDALIASGELPSDPGWSLQ